MRRSRGFTLVELMAVVVITGVLAVAATSTWPAYMQRTRRTAAGAALVAALSQLELRHARTGTYDGDPGPMPKAEGYVITTQECMSLDVTLNMTDCVQLVAYPTNGTDKACPYLALRSTGEREPANAACWP